jgi:hypothetical protein
MPVDYPVQKSVVRVSLRVSAVKNFLPQASWFSCAAFSRAHNV